MILSFFGTDILISYQDKMDIFLQHHSQYNCFNMMVTLQLGGYKLSACVAGFDVRRGKYPARYPKIFFLKLQELIFSFASYPMDLVDSIMRGIKTFIGNMLNDGMLKDLIVNGILEGIGAIVISCTHCINLLRQLHSHARQH